MSIDITHPSARAARCACRPLPFKIVTVVYTVYADCDSGMRMVRNDDHDDAHELRIHAQAGGAEQSREIATLWQPEAREV